MSSTPLEPKVLFQSTAQKERRTLAVKISRARFCITAAVAATTGEDGVVSSFNIACSEAQVASFRSNMGVKLWPANVAATCRSHSPLRTEIHRRQRVGRLVPLSGPGAPRSAPQAARMSGVALRLPSSTGPGAGTHGRCTGHLHVRYDPHC